MEFWLIMIGFIVMGGSCSLAGTWWDRKNKKDKKEEKSKKSGSIYDLLENNKNIIWKSTGTSDNINKSTIPVIGNNNLKPEILGSSKVDDLAFPDMNKKEGEILWKETM